MTICMPMKGEKTVRKAYTIVATALICCQVAVVIGSWIAAAAMPETTTVRSLLSGDGIRWFLGMFAENLATPYLVWLITLSLAFGAFCKSGIADALAGRMKIDAQIRFAFKLVACEVAVFVLVLLSLTIVPHAILLSVTGDLFPSSFSRSLVPVISFAVCVFSISFGVVVGRVKCAWDVFSFPSTGLAYAAPLFLIYILLAQLYFSIAWVFNI